MDVPAAEPAILVDPDGMICRVAPPLVSMLVEIDSLHLDPQNARTHNERNLAAIRASLNSFGQDQPLVVRAEDRVVYKGNGRLLAARALGWSHIAAVIIPGDRVDFVARSIADNRTAELAEWDDGVLAKLLDSFPDEYDLGTVGFSDREAAALLAELDRAGANDDPSEAPPVPPEPVTQPGDSWLLGHHLLVQGDSTDPATAEKVFALGPADMLLSAPPYGVAYTQIHQAFGDGHRHDAIANDDATTDMTGLFVGFLSAARLREPNTAFLFMSSKHYGTLERAMISAGFYKSTSLVWAKNSPVLGRQDYMHQHEHILYGWKGTHRFYGKKRSSVLQYDRPSASKLHPTMKPVDLLASLITDGSARGATVYDPFLGSGSTLIACQMTGRRCVGVELSLAYCDVIASRWAGYTGRAAERIRPGEGPTSWVRGEGGGLVPA